MAKKMIMRKVLSCLVVIGILMSAMPVSVFAVNDSNNATGNTSNLSNETLLEKAFGENNSVEVMIPLFNNWTEDDNISGDCAPIPDADMPEIYLNDTQESVASWDSGNDTGATILTQVSNDTRKNVSALGCNVYVKIDDDTCVGYEVYVDSVYQLTEGEGGTPDGFCSFYVTAGTHTIEIRKNGCSASITKDFQCGVTYRWISMPDYWCECGDQEGTLSINVWTDKSEYKIGETVTFYYKTNQVCTAKLTVTKPDGGKVVYGPNEIPVGTRSKSATAGYPTGKRTVVFEAWAGDEYKKATCYFDVVDIEEAKEVKFRGKILADHPIISFYSFDIKIDKILDDPTGNLQKGETVNVYGHRDGPAQVDDVTEGDKVEVYGEYRGHADGPVISPYEQVFLSDWGESSSDHYVKKIGEDIIFTAYLDHPYEINENSFYLTMHIEKVLEGPEISGLIGVEIAGDAEEWLTQNNMFYADKVEVYAWYLGKKEVPFSSNKEHVASMIGNSKYYVKKTGEPDLIINRINWSPPNPKKGDTITFTIKTTNTGAGDAESFYIYYYIEGSYKDRSYISSLSAGTTATTSFTWTADRCGNVQVKAVADATNAVDEGSNEGNNERTETVSVICLFYIRPACQDVNGNHLDDVSYEFVSYPTYKGTCDYSEYLIAPGHGTYKVKFTKGDLEATITLEPHLKSFAGTVVTLRRKEKKPDLIIQDTSWSPEKPKQGDTVTFTVTVKNQGDEDAGKFWVCCNVGTYVPLGYFDHEIPALSAGKEYAFSHTCKISKCGTFEVQAVADFDDSVKESNEDNNVKRETINIQCPPKKPDLTVYTFWIKSIQPKLGDKIPIYLEVKNVGTASAKSSIAKYYVGTSKGIILGTDSVYPYSNYAYIGTVNIPALAKGEVAKSTFNWIANKCGYVRIRVDLDADNEVDESNEANNQESDDIYIICPIKEKPDLIIKDISWNPKNPKQGDNVEFAVTVKNIGKGIAEESHVFIYTINWDAGKILFKIKDLCPSLKPGEVYTYHKNVKIEDCGESDLMAWADARNEVTESNEKNNYKGASFTVPCPKEKPDLIIKDIEIFPNPSIVGVNTIFEVIVKNQGKSNASKFTVRGYLTKDKPGSRPFKTFNWTVNSLPANTEIPLLTQYKVQQCGEFKCIAWADPDFKVDETDDFNNIKSTTFEVEGHPVWIIVNNIEGHKLPKCGGDITVKAYNSSGIEVAQGTKSYKGGEDAISIELRVLDRNDNIKVFHTPKIKDGATEYWGSMNLSGKMPVCEFVRHTPWITSVTINNKPYTDLININNVVNYATVSVTNPEDTSQEVAVEFILDRDMKSSWDFISSNQKTIDSTKVKDFDFTYAPHEETTGIWKFRVIALCFYGEKGQLAVTDQHDWYLIVGEKQIMRARSLQFFADYYIGILGQEPEDAFNERMAKAWANYTTEIGEITSKALATAYDPTAGKLIGIILDKGGSPHEEGVKALWKFSQEGLDAWSEEFILNQAKKCKIKYKLERLKRLAGEEVDCWKSVDRDINKINHVLIEEGERLSYVEGFVKEFGIGGKFVYPNDIIGVESKIKKEMDKIAKDMMAEWDYAGQTYNDLNGLGEYAHLDLVQPENVRYYDWTVGHQSAGSNCAMRP